MNGKKTAYWLIGIGVTITLVLFFLYLFKTTELNSKAPIDTNIFASYGSLIGGILGALFSLAGIFLLINTLESQERAIDIQQTNFSKQLFESKFFDLVNIHRQNSAEINVVDRTGRKVFLTLQREFYHCKLVIDAFNETWHEKLSEEEIINISYLCFFFGAVGETSEQIIKRSLSNYLTRVNSIIQRYKECQKGFTENDNFPYKLFEGHQSRLGHYFRHLYQVVKFVDEQPTKLLTYKEKYSYVKILRAQLSTQEQAFLFYNSLSDLGKAWEKGDNLDENRKLITKYNLIKNIPTGYTSGFEVGKYYPDIRYEGYELTDKRKELEKTYS